MLDPSAVNVTPPILLGPEYTSWVQLLAPVSYLWDTPILTYAASSPYLSAKVDHPSVWRTCMNDAVQVKAWADLCVKFSWKNVIILVESSSYSQAATEYFLAAAFRADIAVTTIKIDDGTSKARPRIREALEQVRKSGIKIIFTPILNLVSELLDTAIEEKMFGRSSFVKRESSETIRVQKQYPPTDVGLFYNITLSKNVRRGDPRIQGYVWNLVDSVAGIMNSKYTSLVEGTLAFNEPTTDVLATFNQTKYIPFLNDAFNYVCSLYAASNDSSSSRDTLSSQSSRSSRFAINGRIQADLCRTRVSTSNMTLLLNAKAALFSSYPLSLARAIILICDISEAYYRQYSRFPTSAEMPKLMSSYKKNDSFGVPFSFNGYREWTDGQLVLINARRGDYMHEVARWSNLTGFKGINDKNMVWADGTNRVPDDGIALENYIFLNNFLGIFIIFLTVILLIGLVLTAIGLAKFWSTPVFRLATPELLAMMLGGLFLLSISVIAHIGRPSPIICAMGTWPYYVGITFIYSPLIMKTHRILVIFNYSNQLKRSQFSTKRLIILTLLLAFIPTLLATLRPIVSTPADYRILSPDGSRVDVKCIIRYWAIPWAQLGAAAVQMLISTYLAWNTRNVPDGFNESKYVFMSTYIMSTIGILGLVVSFLVESSNSALSSCFLAFSSLFTTSACWALLFMPKLHLAIFTPKKNCLNLIKEHSSRHMTMQDVPEYEMDEQSVYEAPVVVKRNERG